MSNKYALKKVVLLSGGIDSTTTLAIALQDSYDDQLPNPHSDVMAISFNYGQRHSKELQQAAAIAAHYEVPHFIIDVPKELFQGSRLTDGDAVPDGKYEDYEGLSPAYVPYRNGTLISMAGAFAQGREFQEVWFGAHASDWQTWAYPDCSPSFTGAQGTALYMGTNNTVQLKTPIIQLEKKGVVEIGHSLNIPEHLTWSCYKGGDKQCGTCPTCNERIDAFKANGLVDPVPYEVNINWQA